jgi:hypothetical protein
MDIQVIVTFAGLCAVFVAACILTVASSTYVNAVFNELIKPVEGTRGRNAVFKIEIEDSGKLRDIVAGFPGFYCWVAAPLVISLSAVLSVCIHSLYVYGPVTGVFKDTFFPQGSEWLIEVIRYLPSAVLVSFFFYPFMIASRVWKIKKLYVQVMRRHAVSLAEDALRP